jgi:hypothetical protein
VSWYGRRLAKHFHNIGGGVFVKKPAAVTNARLGLVDYWLN